VASWEAWLGGRGAWIWWTSAVQACFLLARMRLELTLTTSLRPPSLLDVGVNKCAAQRSWTFTREMEFFLCQLMQVTDPL
jgi:hypothetical protein